MFNKENHNSEMQKNTVRNLFLIASLPLICAVVLATYYANQQRPSEALSATLKNLTPIGEIVKGDIIEMHFKCPVDKLESIGLKAATYQRTNTARYKIKLQSDIIYVGREFELDASKVQDNAWVNFKLDQPLDRCKSRPLRLTIESVDATPGNAITFYVVNRYVEGQIVRPIRTDLANMQLALELNMPATALLSASNANITTQPQAARVNTKTLVSPQTGLDHFGEVLAGQSITQTIACPVEKLTSIAIKPATYKRTNAARYKLTLTGEKGAIQSFNLSGQDVRDNISFPFKLKTPIDACIGQKLTLKLEAQDAKPGNALTFYHVPTYYTGELTRVPKIPMEGRQLLIEMNL